MGGQTAGGQMQKCEHVLQSGPGVWVKDVYRVGQAKQVRPQDPEDEREKTQTDQLPSQPSLSGRVVRWEIQTFGGQTTVLPGSSIHQPRGLDQLNLSEPASASEQRSYLTPSRNVWPGGQQCGPFPGNASSLS